MNDVNNGSGERLSGLNSALKDVELDLVNRALDRSRGEAEAAYDFINKAADADLVDIGCGDEDGDDSSQGDKEEPDVEDGDSDDSPEDEESELEQ